MKCRFAVEESRYRGTVPLAGYGRSGGLSWAYHQTLAAKTDTDTNTGTRTRNYSYDQAGRLTQTVEGATTRRYAYDANTNRCALAAACDNTWTYNTADQVTASPQATSYRYNNHGQLTAATRTDIKVENIGYDANDHPVTIDDGTTTIAETLAPGGRVLERKVTNDTTHARPTCDGSPRAWRSKALAVSWTGGAVGWHRIANLDADSRP